MRRLAIYLLALLPALFQGALLRGQDVIKVEAPSIVALDEQFNVTFVIDGREAPKSFEWSPGPSFQLVWGPTRGMNSSTTMINGKTTRTAQVTYTYILLPKATGKFSLPQATAVLDGKELASQEATIEVVSDGARSSGGGQSSGGGSSSQGAASGGGNDAAATGDVSSDDLFLRLSLSKTNVVIGEPVTATLKLYQRVNISGFDNIKFPSFNGFWSQETYAPSNIEFKRESFNDKIYNTAVLRSWVLIPQQAGTLTIDPSELVVLVNIRVSSGRSNSIFDSFFQDDFRTVRKRVVTPAVNVNVSNLPAGAPESFSGAVGKYSMTSTLSKDSVKAHDAASLLVTISGKGNVSLLDAPKVSFPPDFEVYDVKTTQNTDRSGGGTSGSKTFEYPFIPRSHGDFTIDPVRFTYYDVEARKYVTLETKPLGIGVAKGEGEASAGVSNGLSIPSNRKDVKNLGDDIRFISTAEPSLRGAGRFFLGSVPFWIILALILCGGVLAYLLLRSYAAHQADVAGKKNRGAVKMARKRLAKAGEYLSGNLSTAFYEELHKALLGFVSDKFNMEQTDLNRDNITSVLSAGGADEAQVEAFGALLDACEEARYSPEANLEAMDAHYKSAIDVISSISSSMKGKSGSGRSGLSDAGKAALSLALLLTFGAASLQAQEFVSQQGWDDAVQAYSDGRWSDARNIWENMVLSGQVSASLYCNLGNACFKEGDLAHAVLNYERALKADPSYKDARYNLDLTNSLIQDRIDDIPEFVLKAWVRKLCYLAGSDAWAVIFLILLAAAVALGLLFFLSARPGVRKTGFYCGIVALLLSLCALGFSSWQKSDYSRRDGAVVVAPVTSVKSSPSGGSAKDLFILHEGTVVRILDSLGEWTDIELSDGRQGWISTSAIEVI